jgi:hypothetical protein
MENKVKIKFDTKGTTWFQTSSSKGSPTKVQTSSINTVPCRINSTMGLFSFRHQGWI